MKDTNILSQRIGSIPLWNATNHATRRTNEYYDDDDAQTSSYQRDDPSIFEDADEENETQISGLSYFSALRLLSSSASFENGTSNSKANLLTSDFNIRNNHNKRGVSSNNTSNSSFVATRDDPGRSKTQLSEVNKIQHRMTLTKQTCKAFALELAGNPASSIQPLPTNDTMKPMTLVASSKLSMPKTDVPSKSFDMRRQITTSATATNETKHDIMFPNILSSIEKEKVQFVIFQIFNVRCKFVTKLSTSHSIILENNE